MRVASRHDQGLGSCLNGLRRALQSNTASTEYSATWPPLRTTVFTASMASSEMFGMSQCNSGPRMREVRFDDNASVEPQKIKPIQKTTGSQYLKNKPFPDTAR